MPENHPPTSHKPHLDDLLATIGVTREQMTEMTAGDLFAAATQWQQTTPISSAAVKHLRSPIERLVHSLHWPSIGVDPGRTGGDMLGPGLDRF
jgi:hypothetical protein